MKTYKDLYEPFEAEIEDDECKLHLLKAKKITLEVMDEMEAIIKKHSIIVKNAEGADVKDFENVSGMIGEQLILFFGKDMEFWKKFNSSLLNDILQDVKNDTGSKKNK